MQKIEIPRAKLYDLYVNQELSAREVARRIGCSKPTVLTRLREYNIPIRKNSTPRKYKLSPETLSRLYWYEGLSQRQMSIRLNVTQQVISFYMKRFGIPTRSLSEARSGRRHHFYGKKLSAEHCRKLSESHKGQPGYWSGKQRSEETKRKISRSRRGKYIGEKAGHWKGGAYAGNYRSLAAWKDWRKAVFERDDYTCQMCGKRGVYLEPHHIWPKAKYPNRVFDVTNGITLCRDCHNLTKGKEESFIPMLEAKIQGGERNFIFV